MVRQSILHMAWCRALTQDVIGGFTLAKRCSGQFALDGADRRGWRFRSIGVVVFCRLCTGLDWFNGLPGLLKRLSRGGSHSCTCL